MKGLRLTTAIIALVLAISVIINAYIKMGVINTLVVSAQAESDLGSFVFATLRMSMMFALNGYYAFQIALAITVVIFTAFLFRNAKNKGMTVTLLVLTSVLALFISTTVVAIDGINLMAFEGGLITFFRVCSLIIFFSTCA